MPELQIEGVGMNFGGLQALKNVTMTIQEKEFRGIIGPNGSGKTTLFNCISGFYLPTKGKISYGHTDITRLPPHRVLNIGIVRTFQTVNLFKELSIEENVLVGFHHTLRHVGLWEIIRSTRANRKEDKEIRGRSRELLRLVGINEPSDTKPRRLSYGKQKALEIARALATQPKILMLDEPASGLNPFELSIFREILERIYKTGITIILIEHHMQLVMGISQKVTCLDYGQIIAEGTPSEVASNAKVTEAYLGKRGTHA